MSIKLQIKVFPKSSVAKIVESGDLIKVYVKSAPDKGRANKDVIGLISKKYSVRKCDVKIIKGQTNRNKVLEVEI